jgi:beta-lactamase regulating signal transducer with metallopeptidase domain
MSLFLRVYPGDTWALLTANALIQATAVILAAWLLARLGSRWNAAWRYSIYLAAILCVLATPALAWIMQQSGIGLMTLEPPVPTASTGLLPTDVPESGPREMSAPLEAAAVDTGSEPEGIQQPVRSEPPSWPSLPDTLRAAGGAAMVVWLAGVALLLARWCHGLHLTARLRRTAQPLDPSTAAGLLRQVRRALGADRLPPMAVSARLERPVMVGLMHPLVIVPEDVLQTFAEPELVDILVHECAHVVCRHQLISLVQRVAGMLFWPHPLMHVLNWELARAREEVCDNYVLRQGDASRYARALFELCQSPAGVSAKSYAIGLFHYRWRLEDRIVDLLDQRRKVMTGVGRWTASLWTVAFLGLSLFVAGTGVIQAEPSTGQAASPVEKPAASDAIVEGVGWKDVRVGMTREDLIRVMGKPDNNPSGPVLKWARKHLDCGFHPGSAVVSEVRFTQGFQGSLANGIKVGSAGSAMLKLYGEPEHVNDPGNGAKQYEFSSKGILFWTNQGKITQITVFKPYRLQTNTPTADPPRILSTSPADGAKEVDPATAELTVTFDQDMEKGFTWNGSGPDFPFLAGSQPFWRNPRTCVLPVKLEAGRDYSVGLNVFSPNYQAFWSTQGVRALPATIRFSTRGPREPEEKAEAPKSPPASPKAEPNSQVVVEGVGWEGFKVGATREEMIKTYGEPEPTAGSRRTHWTSRHHVDCFFGNDGRAVDVQFTEGFKLPLASGIKIGSSEQEVLSAYGAPDSVVVQSDARLYMYNQGILLWIADDKVATFTVANPRELTADLVVGIGLSIEKRDGAIVVQNVIPKSPAAAAGVLQGDILLQIDGQPVQGTVEEAAKRIRGEADTVVKLRIRKKDGAETELSIRRQVIQIP